MDGRLDDRNTASRKRLLAIAERLTDEELERSIDGLWTPAALLAHMAFWDRFVHARWQLAARTGSRMPSGLDDAVMELINGAALPQWTLLSPRRATDECLSAADQVDSLVASLDAALISEIVATGRERLVDRSLHRREHIHTIEAAFPAP
jgi:hypothetical protein